MGRMNLSTTDLFLKLGATPRTRSIRAEQLFRKLRGEEAIDLEELLTKAPRRVNASANDGGDAPARGNDEPD